MPLDIFKILFPKETLETLTKHKNKKKLMQLGLSSVTIKHKY